MSYYDDASLVVIPSGYKTSKVYAEKPTDGSGDLAFTRTGDTATRVNSAGLIEKVRTNVLTYSNTFSNAAWTKTDSSVTSGQSGYDGTNNAWLLANTASSGNLTQTISFSGFNTLSVYAKAGTHQNLYILLNGSGFNATASYNLSTGVISNASADALITTATSVGNGWWRLTITGSRSNVDVRISPSNNNSGGASTNGNILIQNIQLEAGDIATDYIPTTTAAVSVGPVANVPRLDYLGSTCGKLLLEPQRTNSAQYSEQTDNAYWIKFQATITANQATSPDGTMSADRITTTGADSVIYRTGMTAGALSFFIKAETLSAGSRFYIAVDGVGSATWSQNGTLFAVTGGTATNAVDYNNGWYRCNFNVTSGAVINYGLTNAAVGNTAFIWGIQNEASATYATSLIPTLAASATRGADAALTASVPSLIGQTEGTFFIDFNRIDSFANSVFIISNIAGTTVNSYHNSIYFYQQANGTLVVDGFVSNVQQFGFINSGLSVGNHKMAIAYKANDFVLYVDGVQVGTDVSGSVPAMNFLTIASAGDVPINNQKVSQVLLFKTRLTNAELAELTTL